MSIKQVLKKVTKEYLLQVTTEMTKAMNLEDEDIDIQDLGKKELLNMIISDSEIITKDDSFSNETWDFLVSAGCKNAIKYSPKKEEPAEVEEVIEEILPEPEIVETEPEVAEIVETEPEIAEDAKPDFINTVPVPTKKKPKKGNTLTRRQVTGIVFKEHPATRDEFTQQINDMYVYVNNTNSNMKESTYFSKITLQILEAAGMVSVTDGNIEYLT